MNVLRYREPTKSYICKSNVGIFTQIPTNTTIGRECYSRDKIVQGGVSWVVLHEVCFIKMYLDIFCHQNTIHCIEHCLGDAFSWVLSRTSVMG